MKHSVNIGGQENKEQEGERTALQQEPLFLDQNWLLKLERMMLISNSKMRGLLAGKRRSSQIGASLDFADYRLYVPGDDIRRLDWNVYGRTNKAVIRQYWDEQERSFHLYIDASLSMTASLWDKVNKYKFALQLAASVAYIALQSDDRVVIRQFDDKEILDSLPSFYGKGAGQRCIRAITEMRNRSLLSENDFEARQKSAVHTEDEIDLMQAFRQGAALPVRAGVTWLITDGYYDKGFEQLLSELRARQQEVVVVLIFHQQELEPQLSGELKLIDVEVENGKDVAISSGILSRYKEELNRFLEQLKVSCTKHGAALYLFNASEQLEKQFIMQLIQQGQINSK